MALSTLFLRACWVAQGYRSLAEGEKVEFDLEQDNTGRKKAINVTGPGGANVQGAPRPPQEGYGGGGGGYSQVSWLTSPASRLNHITRLPCWVDTLEDGAQLVIDGSNCLSSHAAYVCGVTPTGMQGGGGYGDYGSGGGYSGGGGGYNQVRGTHGRNSRLLLGTGKANHMQISMLCLQRAGQQGRCFCSKFDFCMVTETVCSFHHRVAMVAAATVATVAATAVAVAVAEAPTATEAPLAPAKSMHWQLARVIKPSALACTATCFL